MQRNKNDTPFLDLVCLLAVPILVGVFGLAGIAVVGGALAVFVVVGLIDEHNKRNP